MTNYIVLPSSSVGLQKDALILSKMFNNTKIIFDFDKILIESVENNRNDIFIFIEIVVFKEKLKKNYIKLANTFLLPNIEYSFLGKYFKNLCIHSMKEYLESFNIIFCKTYQLYKLLYSYYKINNINSNFMYIGFTSIPIPIKETKVNKDVIFYNQGGSLYRNHEIVIQTWKKYTDLPLLIYKVNKLPDSNYFKKCSELIKSLQYEKNIFLKHEKYSYDDYNTLLNSYDIFLCISMCEGFGHYIQEALGMGKIVVCLNMEPMNEYIKDGYNGFLIDSYIQRRANNIFNLPLYNCKEVDLYKKIQYVVKLSEEKKEQIRQNAKKTFNKNRDNFIKNYLNLELSNLI
jgi:glycosyltransferase involved in cell wall biosynthesis